MQYIKIALPLALASSAFGASVLERDGWSNDDACMAAVTGKNALGDDKIRADHCSSYLIQTVTKEAAAVTTTITEAEKGADWEAVETGSPVTVCPNQVPRYASACDHDDAYASACKVYAKGTKVVTTVTATAVTKTVIVRPNNACPTGKGGDDKDDSDKDDSDKDGDRPAQGGKCLTDEKAKYFVDSFVNLLEYTSYNGSRGGPVGRGFNTDLAKAVLTEDFQDISDSINLLAGNKLGSVTFPNRAAFIAGQSQQPEVKVLDTKVWHNCKSLSFRYTLSTGLGPNLPVVGINVMELNDDLSQVKLQYAEFNSGAWLADLGNPQCPK